MKKIISIVLASAMLTASVSALAVNYGEEYTNMPAKTYTQKFDDVPSSHWAFAYIGEMSDREVVSGYPNGKFYPNNEVTRAEFARIMTSASGLQISAPTSKDFNDVALDAWYAPYVHAAYPYLSGYNRSGGSYYMPDTPALREDIAVALVKLKGYDTLGADESLLKTMFTDVDSISSDARKYVAVAVERGLVSGYEDDTFRGQNSITRAEATAMLWRAYQYGNDNKSFDVEVSTPTPATPIPSATAEPTATPTPKETETPEPTEEPTSNDEYTFELKTLVNNIKDISHIVGLDSGILYQDGKKIMQLDYDSNSPKTVLDVDELPYLGNKDLTKEQQANLKTELRTIGYNPYNKCIYAMIEQNDSIYSYDSMRIYNVTDEQLMPCTAQIDIEHKSALKELNLEFNNQEEFCLGGNWSATLSLCMVDVNDDEVQPIGSYNCPIYFYNNYTFALMGGEPYIMSNRTGKWEELDYYNNELNSKGTIFNAGRNGRIYAVAKDYSSNAEGIYSFDLSGNDELLCYFDDIDNTDIRVIAFSELTRMHSAVDGNGVIYYWDTNYNCIRQLSEK